MRVDDIVRQEIAGLGIGLSLGQNLFGPDVGPGPGTEQNGVYVFSGGGPTPDRTMTFDEVRFSVVNVRVRWRSYNEGADKAQAIIDNLQGKIPSGLLYLTATESEPNYIGQTGQGLHSWSLGFQAIRSKDAPS